jgi:O-antigen ligase
VPIGLVTGAVIIATASALLSSRAESLARLMATKGAGEIRSETFRAVFDLAHSALPLGTGIGTFVEAYERIEPDSMLSPTYLNHAHNDFLELIVTGGVPAILLIAAGLAWAALEGFYALRHTRAGHPGGRTAMAGVAVIFILAAASILDYPLRTPALACLLASAAVWLCTSAKTAKRCRANDEL